MYKEIFDKIIENTSNELNKPENINYIKKNLIEPLIQETISSIYHYVIFLIISIVLIFIIIISILFLNIRVCYKIK